MKVDALKIREIARKLGVSERTVEEYLLDRLTLQQDEDGEVVPFGAPDQSGVVDRFGKPVTTPVENEAG